MRRLILPVVLLTLATLPAAAGDRDFGDRREELQSTRVLRIATPAGDVFRPDRLVILGPDGTRETPLPGPRLEARSEDRMDLSGLPLVGPVFQPRLSSQDARGRGDALGPVRRAGRTLVLEAARPVPPALPVILTTQLPRLGAVSYRIGTPGWAPGIAPAPGERIGTAFLIDGILVLTTEGREAAWPSVESIVRDLF